MKQTAKNSSGEIRSVLLDMGYWLRPAAGSKLSLSRLVDGIAYRLRKLSDVVRNALFDASDWQHSKRELQALLANVTSPRQIIDLAAKYKGRGFYRKLRATQDRQEIIRLIERIQAIEPKVIVEIGTKLGGTLLIWSQFDLDLLVSIDLPHGIHGAGYPLQRVKLFEMFVANKPNTRLELFRADSQAAETRARLEQTLNGRQIDFLFIDGDHRYTGVAKDFELYSPLVRKGGLIAFHDIRPNPSDPSIEVYQLWDQLKDSPNATELITEPYQGKFGIGVLVKD